LIILLGSLVACGTTASRGTTAPAPATTVQAEGATAAAEGATAEAEGVTTTATTDYGQTLTIMTHDSFNVSADVIAEFEQANQVNVRFLKSGDAGSTLNKAILAKGNPLADVLYGVDNTFFSRALDSGIFESYKPAALSQIPTDLQLDPEGRLTPIDYGFVNFNYDKAAFGEGKLPVPQTLRDLTKPEYKGKVVVSSPATSSPGLAFLLATVATFGETGEYPWTQFWTDMRANDVAVVDGWETAYYTNFSGSSGQGPQPIVLSYATSPAAEVFFSEGKLAEPPTANLLPSKGAFRQIEFAGILQGTKNLELAQRWIDYMVSVRFQADIPLSMFVYPANPEAEQPEVFQKFAVVPAEPAVIAPEEIAAKRDQWIQDWTRIMQH
jgi:thiamine transport system substrate-binding protein